MKKLKTSSLALLFTLFLFGGLAHAVPLQEEPAFPVITDLFYSDYNGDTIVRVTANGIPAIVALPGQDINALLFSTGLTRAEFAKYNDLPVMLVNQLTPGAVYYLNQKKKNTGAINHVLQPRETLWDVSQKYGIRKSLLMKRNRLKSEAVQPGTVLLLNTRRKRREPLATAPVPNSKLAPDPWAFLLKKVRPEQPVNATEPARENTAFATKPAPGQQFDPNAKYHTVKAGESLFNISEMYGVTNVDLKKWNNLDNNQLSPGDVLIVSQKENPGKVAAQQQPGSSTNPQNPVILSENGTAVNNPAFNQPATAAADGIIYHSTKPGQTVYAIARQYNVEPRELMAWNGFNDNTKLEIGQQVIVKQDASIGQPATPATTNPAVNTPATTLPAQSAVQLPQSHSVANGETLYEIADKYQVRVEEIRAWNGMSTNALEPGKVLLIKETNTRGKPANYNTPAVAVDQGTAGANTPAVSPADTVTATTVSDSVRNNRFYALETKPDGVETVRSPNGTTTTRQVYSPPPMDAILVTQKPSADETRVQQQSLDLSALLAPPGSTGTATDGTSTNGTVNFDTPAAPAPGTAPAAGPANNGQPANSNMEARYHTIQKGETLYSLARKYNTSVEQLVEYNGLPNISIRSGQQIIVGYGPQVPKAQPANNPGRAAASKTRPASNTGRKTSASKQGANISAPRLNVNTKLPPNQLGTSFGVGNAAAGENSPYYELVESLNPQKEARPLADVLPATSGNDSAIYHTVRVGETLYGISQKYKLSIARIKSLNNKSNNNLIVGEKLRVR